MIDRPAPQELLGFLAPYPAELVETYLWARESLFSFAPNANEFIFDATQAVTLGLSFTERWQDGFVHLPIYPKHVNLGFNRGATLDDPHGLLVGAGSQVRHIKIVGSDFFDRPEIVALIEQALDRAPGDDVGAGRTNIQVMKGPKRRPSRS